MNWFLYRAAGLDVMLSGMGVSPEVVSYVMSLPRGERQYYVSVLRKDPSLSGGALSSAAESVKPKQVSLYYPEEEDFVSSLPPASQRWALTSLKDARGGDMSSPHSSLLSLHGERNVAYLKAWDDLRRMKNGNSLADLMRFNPRYEVNGKSFDQVIEDIYEWHEVMAGKGSGKMYRNSDPNLVVYGPNWENEDWNGWTVQEVRGENDLAVEGNKMNHCVGSYCDDVESGRVRIFSLRDPLNEPKVTVEMNSDMSRIEQVQGNSNSSPEDRFMRMLGEWFRSLPKKPFFGDGNEQDNDEYADWLESLREYGVLPDVKWSGAVGHAIFLSGARDRADNSDTYPGSDRIGESLVDSAVEVGERAVYDLVSAAYSSIDDYMGDIEWDFSFPEGDPDRPDPEEYEDGEDDLEYLEDYEEWISRYQEHVQEEFIWNRRRSDAALGIPMDIVDRFKMHVKRGNIPDYSELIKNI